MAKEHRSRVVIVDDHDLARAGLRAVLGECADLIIVAEASSGEEAFEVCQSLCPTSF